MTTFRVNTLCRRVNLAVVAAAALLWTGPGESADPYLLTHELPLGLYDCPAQTKCPLPEDSAVAWIGGTPRGHLFVVTAPCAEPRACESWVVEKTANGVEVLLGMTGEYMLRKSGGAYPLIETREQKSTHEVVAVEFAWRHGAYVEGDTRSVFAVDGIECGTRSECHDAALAAVAVRPERALKIWEQVHGVSWY